MWWRPSEKRRPELPAGQAGASAVGEAGLSARLGGAAVVLRRLRQAAACVDTTDVARWWLLLGVLGTLLSGCGASVSVSAGVISNNGPYLAAWSKGWTTVERESAPYIPTATSPGACNRGSTKEACFETDLHVAQAIGRLGETLSHISVPAPYETANAEMLHAMRVHLQGLRLRMHSFEAGNYTAAERDAWFTESKALIAASNTLAQKAYASFPQWARPTPAPII
jgi:hypothetical protein